MHRTALQAVGSRPRVCPQTRNVANPGHGTELDNGNSPLENVPANTPCSSRPPVDTPHLRGAVRSHARRQSLVGPDYPARSTTRGFADSTCTATIQCIPTPLSLQGHLQQPLPTSSAVILNVRLLLPIHTTLNERHQPNDPDTAIRLVRLVGPERPHVNQNHSRGSCIGGRRGASRYDQPTTTLADPRCVPPRERNSVPSSWSPMPRYQDNAGRIMFGFCSFRPPAQLLCTTVYYYAFRYFAAAKKHSPAPTACADPLVAPPTVPTRTQRPTKPGRQQLLQPQLAAERKSAMHRRRNNHEPTCAQLHFDIPPSTELPRPALGRNYTALKCKRPPTRPIDTTVPASYVALEHKYVGAACKANLLSANYQTSPFDWEQCTIQ